MNNVIDLAARRKAKNPRLWWEEEDMGPWHFCMAITILLQTVRPGACPLNEWERRFVAAMTRWQKEPTPKQEACLIAIRDRVEAVSSAWQINDAFRQR
jgi:hypothetical protein